MTSERPWAYSAFRVEVRGSRRLSPRFLRLTLAGESLRHFAPWGLDQRIKIVLPLSGGGIAEFGLLDEPTPHPSEWYSRWRALAEAERNVLRTYTPSAIRSEQGEIDVDFFLHEPAGPASAWAASARPGDQLVVTGPDARMGRTGYGIHWNPGEARRFLLVADETAYPAVRNILRSLAPEAHADVLLEVTDHADDVLSQDAPRNANVRVSIRGKQPETGVETAVRDWGETRGTMARDDGEFYAWLAGEAGSITRVRRYLTRDLGISKERVAFLGYWRVGGPLVG
ncbi:siderophore-interacting protein [Microbacterium murale]|uniref:NADPH-dependent ferric siderophore reductase n=1 Tax=Microbacterium murale TaxID=1081040 RepID=A0ABU0P4Y8_9MICO|nr:siderophore-interacting protein [Microbacterium murale]MDQ0642012.1 NADPH-dependent ferric siderophore reductase [Microbacterium murale]